MQGLVVAGAIWVAGPEEQRIPLARLVLQQKQKGSIILFLLHAAGADTPCMMDRVATIPNAHACARCAPIRSC